MGRILREFSHLLPEGVQEAYLLALILTLPVILFLRYKFSNKK